MPPMFSTDLRKQPTLPRETSCLPSGEKDEELSTAKATIGWCCWHLWHRCSTQCTMLQRHCAWCGWEEDTRWRESGRTTPFNQSQLFRKEGDSIKIRSEAEGNYTYIKSLNLLDHSVQVNSGRANLEKTCLVAIATPAKLNIRWPSLVQLKKSEEESIRMGNGSSSSSSQQQRNEEFADHDYEEIERGTWEGRRSSRGTTASSPWTSSRGSGRGLLRCRRVSKVRLEAETCGGGRISRAQGTVSIGRVKEVGTFPRLAGETRVHGPPTSAVSLSMWSRLTLILGRSRTSKCIHFGNKVPADPEFGLLIKSIFKNLNQLLNPNVSPVCLIRQKILK